MRVEPDTQSCPQCGARVITDPCMPATATSATQTATSTTGVATVAAGGVCGSWGSGGRQKFALLAVGILALALAGCAGAPAESAPASPPSIAETPEVTPSPIQEPTPTASPSPTPEPAPVEVARISVSSEQPTYREVWGELHNPNATHGWLRAAVEITALGPGGEVLGVQSGPLAGAPCCTVYRLGPDGSYAVNMLVDGAVEVAGLEIRIIDDPVEWSDVESAIPSVTLLSPVLSVNSFVANQSSYSVTGRVEVAEGGPFNIQVLAFIEGSDGRFWVAQALPECVTAGAPVAFEATSIGPTLLGATLGQVLAVTTTVPGHTDPPPGC